MPIKLWPHGGRAIRETRERVRELVHYYTIVDVYRLAGGVSGVLRG